MRSHFARHGRPAALALFSLIVWAPGIAGAGWIETRIELTPEECRLLRSGDRASLGPDWLENGEEGELLTPVKLVRLELAPGERPVEIEVEMLRTDTLRVEASASGRIPGAPGADGAWPALPARLGHGGGLGPRRLASILVHPFRHRPAEGDWLLHRDLILRVRTEGAADQGLARAPLAGGAAADSAGRAEFTLLRSPDDWSLDGVRAEYLIITDDALAPGFQALADYRTLHGLPAVVRTLGWIDRHYPGDADRPARIRRFIRDAYERWGTRWVLLGGDTDVVPVRLAHIDYYYPAGEDIACDLYYASLEGDWDGDGDGVYGEGWAPGGTPGDSVDLYPDVFLGRAPCSDSLETAVFVSKTIRYENPQHRDYQKKVLLGGEVVFPFDWNGNPAAISLNGCTIAQEAGAWVPGDWTLKYLCQYPDGNFTLANLRTELNSGYNLVSLVDHGDAFKFRVTGSTYMRERDVRALTNDGRFSILYYSNCNTSYIDAECVNEALMLNPTGGAVAAVAPTRLAFPTRTRDYQEEFYRLFFHSGERSLGEVFYLSGIPFAGAAERDDTSWRWTHLSYGLMGDPALRIWRTLPDSLQVAHAGAIGLGEDEYAVQVTAGGAPVALATVVLWNPATGEYARGYTDAAGEVRLPFPAAATGEARLGVNHPLHLPFEAAVAVNPGGARLRLAEVGVDDYTLGETYGNCDGRPDAGEKLLLGLTVANPTGAAAHDVRARLALAPGGGVSASLQVDGLERPGYLFLGRDGTHPPALPGPIGAGGEELLGRPRYAAGARADTLFVPGDTTHVVTGRCYLWQDAAGLHLRACGAKASHLVSGWIETEGRITSALRRDTEAGDGLTVGERRVDFAFALDSTDVEDGVDLAIADSLFGAVLTDSALAFGDIAPGSYAVRRYRVDLAPETPDGRPVRFLVEIESAEGAWSDVAPVLVRAPRPAHLFHEVDDAAPGGDGDGVAEPGETVSLRLHARNLGGAAAMDLQGFVRALAGASVQDSVAAFGHEILPLAVGASLDSVTLTVTDSLPRLEIELRDELGRGWTRQIELTAPGVVTAVQRTTANPRPGGGLDLGWTPPADGDIAGYLVYRGDGPGGPFSPVSEGVLPPVSYFFDGGAAPGATYYYRVVAVDSGGTTGPLAAAAAVTNGFPERAGWPAGMEDVIWASPLPVDLGEDAGGDLEVICGAKDFQVFSWDASGTPLPGWPLTAGHEVWSSAAAADLEGDGRLEVFFGTENGRLYGVRSDGTGIVGGNPVFASLPPLLALRSSPSIGDLDLDGRLEILIGSNNGRLFVLRDDATKYGPDSLRWVNPASGAIFSVPTLANVDADPNPEIFFGTLNGRVFAFNHDRTELINLAGQPDGTFALASGGVYGSISVGDVDDDGAPEVVCAGYNGTLYVWDAAGALEPGWPQTVNRPGYFNQFWSSPALGDLDGDGDLEIVLGCVNYNVYAWHHTGALVAGWPRLTQGEVWASAILVDVDDDLSPEVVIGSTDDRLYAYEADGSAVAGWPLRVGDAIYGGAAAGDLDGDGLLEIMVGSYDGAVHLWSLGKPFHPEASPWPMFAHDPWRSSWSDHPVAAPGVPAVEAGETAAFAPARPNPFNPETVLRYRNRSPGTVRLVIYDVTGRKVRTLVDRREDAGMHEARWDGRTDDGHSVAAGVFFARLESGGGSVRQKLILAR